MDEVDIECLRQQLIDYYGTAIFSIDGFGPLAKIEEIKSMSEEEIIEEARNAGLL